MGSGIFGIFRLVSQSWVGEGGPSFGPIVWTLKLERYIPLHMFHDMICFMICTSLRPTFSLGPCEQLGGLGREAWPYATRAVTRLLTERHDMFYDMLVCQSGLGREQGTKNERFCT